MNDSDNICVCLYLMVIFLVCFVSFFYFICCFVIVFGLSLGLAIVGFVFFFPFPSDVQLFNMKVYLLCTSVHFFKLAD